MGKKIGKVMLQKTESKLINNIRDDSKLTDDEKNIFEVMASFFVQDFENNIKKTSIELNREYEDFSIDDWFKFINYPCVRSYIVSFKNEVMINMADRGVIAGDRGAMGVKKALENNVINNNSNFILVRVPDKIDFVGDTQDANR